MQLVMQRFRLYSRIWFRFRINVRLVTSAEEERLLNKYTLRDVGLTEGHTRRDLFRAALLAIPIAFIFWIILIAIMELFSIVAVFFAILLFLFILIITFALVYMQIREAVMVNDLLVGRDFKARSL